VSLGGKITLCLASLWAVVHLIALAMPSTWIASAYGFLVVLECLHFILAFPLGFIGTGLDSMGHVPTSAEVARYFVLMVPNLFLQGYFLAGIWQLFRRVTGPLRRDFT
jgi:hypothetical protein